MPPKDEIKLIIRPTLEGADLDAALRLVQQKLQAVGKDLPAFSNQAYQNLFKGISDAAALAAMTTNKSLQGIDTTAIKGKADEIVGYWNRSMKALMPPSIPLAGRGGLPGMPYGPLPYSKTVNMDLLASHSPLTFGQRATSSPEYQFGLGALSALPRYSGIQLAGDPVKQKAYTDAVNASKNATQELVAATEKVGPSMMAMAAAGLATYVTWQSLVSAAETFYKTLKIGIKTIDEMKLSAAAMAGAMATADPTLQFDKAAKAAEQMIMQSYVLTARFVGSARDLQVLLQSLTTFGVAIDLSTQKGQDQFVTFANILKMVTAGQNFEIQAFQEVRALMEGQNFQGAMLVRRLQGAGIDVKNMIPLWQEQGTLLENVVNILGGYSKASVRIKDTWEAQSKTLLSVSKILLALGLSRVYDDMVGAVRNLNESLIDSKGLTEKGKDAVGALAKAWDDVKDSAKWYIAFAEYINSILVAPRNIFGKEVSDKGIFSQLISDLKSIDGWLQSITHKVLVKPVAALLGLDTEPQTELGGLKAAALAATWQEEYVASNAITINKVRKAWADYYRELDRLKKLESDYSDVGVKATLEDVAAKFGGSGKGNAPSGYQGWLESLIEKQKKQKLRLEELKILEDGLPKVLYDIKVARDKVATELSKIMAGTEWRYLEKTDPTLANAVRNIWKQVEIEEGLKVGREFEEKSARKIKDAVDHLREKMQDRAEAISDTIEKGVEAWRHARAKYGAAGSDLARELEEIDHRVNREIETQEKAIKRKSLYPHGGVDVGVTPPTPLAPYYDVQPAIEAMRSDAEKRRSYEKMQRIIQENEKALELGKARESQVRAMTHDIENLQKAADVGVEWWWNEREVTLARELSAEMKRHTDLAQKVTEEGEKWNKALAKKPGETPTVGMSPDEVAVALNAIRVLHDKNNDLIREKNDVTTKAISDMWANLSTGIGNVFQSGLDKIMGGMFNLGDFIKSWAEMIRGVFSKMVSDMVADWLRLSVLKPAAADMKDWMGGLSSLFGGGGSPGPGNFDAYPLQAYDTLYGAAGGIMPGRFMPLRAFSLGGIADRPTLGLIGEGDGPEAVVPLKGGNIPVKLQGKQGGDTNINFNITAMDASNFDQLLSERRGMISAIIRSELRNASYTRDAIRRYA